jgi:hypothetical protein
MLQTLVRESARTHDWWVLTGVDDLLSQHTPRWQKQYNGQALTHRLNAVCAQTCKVPAGLVDLFKTWLPVLWVELERTNKISEETLDRMGLPKDAMPMCTSPNAPWSWRACLICGEALRTMRRLIRERRSAEGAQRYPQLSLANNAPQCTWESTFQFVAAGFQRAEDDAKIGLMER